LTPSSNKNTRLDLNVLILNKIKTLTKVILFFKLLKRFKQKAIIYIKQNH